MALTQAQIIQLKKRLKDDGFNDGQIKAGINRIMEEYGQGAEAQQATLGDSVSRPGVASPSEQSQSPSQSGQQPQASQPAGQGGNIVSNFFKSLYTTAVGAPKLAAGVGFEAVRAADYAMGNKQAYDVFEGGKGAKNPFLSKEEIQKDFSNPADIAKNVTKNVAGTASFFVPGGVGVQGALKAGAVSGALFGLSEGEDIDAENIIYGAVGGAAGGAAVPIVGKMLSGAKNTVSGGYKSLFTKTEEMLSDTAAQRINKASPSMWQKAIEDHGLDLNELTKKHFPKGGTYDDLLGKITDRGRGGIFKQKMELAETKIKNALKNVNKNTQFTIDEVMSELQKERNLLAKLPGNENNIAALDEFAKAFQVQYGKGMTPKRALELKRIADSQFGRAVADENTGSAVAQAQKMVANALRSKLKKLIPEIGEALDTETELYTLQPVLNRARATLSTQGSEIRVGSLRGKSLTDLVNPITWFDWYLSDPKRASQFLGKSKAMPELAKEGSKLSGEAVWSQIIGRTIGAQGLTPLGEQPESQNGQQAQYSPANNQESNDIYSQANQNISSTDSSIAQTKQYQQDLSTLPFGGRSKNELLQLALSEGATLKDLKEIAEIYDLIAGEEETTKLELSDSAIKNVTDIKGAIADVQALTQNISQKELTGPIRGLMAKVPYATESRSMQAEIDRVRQVVGKALEGGVLRKEDEEKYKKILPTMEDTKEVALSKLEQLYAKLNEDLNTYVNLQGQYGKGRGFENIINPTQ